MGNSKCPLGEDCDLTLAYMAGAHDAKKGCAAEIERLREALRKIACDDDTCECRAFGSPDAMCELGLARSALEGKE